MYRTGIWALAALTLAATLLVTAPSSAQFRRDRGYYPGYYRGYSWGYYPRSYSWGYYGGPSWGGYAYRPYSYGYGPYYAYTPGVVIGTPPAVSYYYNPAPMIGSSTAPATSGVRPAAGTTSGYATEAAAETAAEATVEVRVPPDAQLWFDGEPTRQAGPQRQFVSPPLPTDRTSAYQVRARWTGSDGAVDQTRRVEVRGGQRTVVDFTQPQ